jgi:chromosomal replication initiation ATPase DnaA
LLILEWSNIRPLKGDQKYAFEELCTQIAREVIPAGAHFERKGTPDGGVECYCALADGTEWGWQAKYVFSLNEAQLRQIDVSIKTALEKHRRLTRYFICLPIDLSDPRVDGLKHARDRWNSHETKWKKWASTLEMAVEFVFWGNSELIVELSQQKHVGRLKFWFDVSRFDDNWFQRHFQNAVATAGPRYTPEINVELPIAADFEAFGRTEECLIEIKKSCKKVREEVRRLGYTDSKIDKGIEALVDGLIRDTENACAKLGAAELPPIGPIPFGGIAKQIDFLLNRCRVLESELWNKRPQAPQTEPPPQPFQERRTVYEQYDNLSRQLYRVISELDETKEVLEHVDSIASNQLMVVTGSAGIGKTHLLCDVARKRLEQKRPTLLLMGQQFQTLNSPWSQALEQLDLRDLSVEEFLGALEAAAQAANSRALLMIDAINEGAGKQLWHTNLAAFFNTLSRSKWIGTVLSVRTPYEKLLITDDMRGRAYTINHVGFEGYEYDATYAFFKYYGLEFPSTPQLVPEFRNPLFLKSLCIGLRERGNTRLPRGLHGFTEILNLYTDGLNTRISRALDYDPKSPLVRKALDALAQAMVVSGERWLDREHAKTIVDNLLPGRSFDKSLFKALVSEGLLIEQSSVLQPGSVDEYVVICYERFADHSIANIYLNEIQDADALRDAFDVGSPLAFLTEKRGYGEEGLLEALCMLVPEKFGVELTTVVPALLERWGIENAVLGSIAWRAISAFPKKPTDVFKHLVRHEQGLHQVLDTVLTVSPIPEHPLNADYLHAVLTGLSMPKRDSWWSTFLYSAYGSHGAVDRLISWAHVITPEADLDKETVELCATALAWMLTTSNRYLRDRATTALVDLLTGRLEATAELLTRFKEVDDLYVAERVYAVSYGVAMRSVDLGGLGKLAQIAYDHVFKDKTPPAHILLRDYARGIVEWALHLKATVTVNVKYIRPPYKSKWPGVPSEKAIKPLMPDWSRGSYDSGEHDWSRNRIGSSVLSDDFARYVIGTNSSRSNWLRVKLDKEPWQSPEERLVILEKKFSTAERRAWAKLREADRNFNVFSWPGHRTNIRKITNPELKAFIKPSRESTEDEQIAKKVQRLALQDLKATLTKPHLRELLHIRTLLNRRAREVPSYGLKSIQRYVLWRVFDLGWTVELFGKFDRFSVGTRGRDASKAERIGKKYQWIAYHEFLAYLSDHYQYREDFGSERAREYLGPWQDGLRDIDPSCTLRSAPGGTGWGSHNIAWWASSTAGSWIDPPEKRAWAADRQAMPMVEPLLMSQNPKDGTTWVNLNGYFTWKSPLPPDKEFSDVERRQIWYLTHAYLLKKSGAPKFMEWARKTSFYGHWMPEPARLYKIFLGEHGWSAASKYFESPYYGDSGFNRPEHGCPVAIATSSVEYLREISGFDCSLDDTYSFHLPSSYILRNSALRWFGFAADYVDATNRLAAFDPTAHEDGPDSLLFRADLMRAFLEKKGLALCWTVIGEREVHGPGLTSSYVERLPFSGAYNLTDNGPEGFINAGEQESYSGT